MLFRGISKKASIERLEILHAQLLQNVQFGDKSSMRSLKSLSLAARKLKLRENHDDSNTARHVVPQN
jgi:hypothetical protein